MNNNDLWNTPSMINFNESIRINRNYEELICERGDVGGYTDLFKNIQDKLFVTSEDDPELLQSQKKEFSDKYKIPETTQVISELKDSVAKLYIKKIEQGVIIEERRRLFNSFCTHIIGSIKSMEEITNGNETEKDIELKKILNERIDWYYGYLELEKLIEEEYNLKAEFLFLQTTLTDISRISVPGLCMICMESQVSWFIDPCGHTLCENCKERTTKTQNCHYCRTPKTKCNRLYL